MSEELPSHDDSGALLRQCVAVLDSSYSHISNKDHIDVLNTIEEKLFQGQFKDVASFRAELSSMSDLQLDALDSSNNAADTFDRDIYNLPIFSSTTYKAGSTMYSVHDKSPNPINSWLPNDVFSLSNTTTTNTASLCRLFVSKNGNQLIHARNNMDATLAIFTDLIVSPVQTNATTVSINTNVTIVHPLGPLHKSNIPDYDNWIKVSIIKKSRILTIIPADLANTLFEQNVGSVQTLHHAGITREEQARGNQVTRQFAFSVMNDARNSLFNTNRLMPNSQMSSLIHVCNHAKNFELISNEQDALQDEKTADMQREYTNPSNIVQCYSDHTRNLHLEEHWKKLEHYAITNKCSIVHKKDYEDVLHKPSDVANDFKHVYLKGGDAIHIFQKTPVAQQISEIACQLKVNRKQHIGHIHQVIMDDDDIEMIGFTTPKYEMTLKDYLQQNQQPHLSSLQRMDLIVQMIKAVKTLHDHGIAHRDLSLASFMVTSSADKLLDGSPKIHLHLTHFGRAVLFTPADARKWWIDGSEDHNDKLSVWCKNLPYVMARPDHSHLLTRSIQTLPKMSKDHAILPYLINAPAEDVYSLGTLMWHIFSGMQAWPGLVDTDLKRLRETVHCTANIDSVIDIEMPGPVSTTFLKKILCVEPEDRLSAAEVLEYIENTNMRDVLLLEWNSSIIYTETITQPILDENIKSANKRGVSADMEQLNSAKRGRLESASLPVSQTTAASQDQLLTDVSLEGQSNQIHTEENAEAAASAEPKPKTPKKYYIPTGRPVGRPRKKVRPKPPGRPKGSKNKVYYYVTEEEEKARLEAEKAEKEKEKEKAESTNLEIFISESTQAAVGQGEPHQETSDVSNLIPAAATMQVESTTTADILAVSAPMEDLPNITPDTLTEAAIQEILSKVVNAD